MRARDYEYYNSFLTLIDVKVTLHAKSGDINLPFGNAKEWKVYMDEKFTLIKNMYTCYFGDYYLFNNKVLQVDGKYKGKVLVVDIYEINEIDAVYWMSDCINIKDKVYEIVDRDSDADIIYIKELDLA